MPAIPEHFGDELSPRALDRENGSNFEPLYEIGKFAKILNLLLDKNVAYQVSRLGFPKEHIVESLLKNMTNHCTATYYLLIL